MPPKNNVLDTLPTRPLVTEITDLDEDHHTTSTTKSIVKVCVNGLLMFSNISAIWIIIRKIQNLF